MEVETENPKTDIILSMARTPSEDYMQQIVSQIKTHEFRKRLYPSTVQRIWFYETSPISAITYICGTLPAHNRITDGTLDDEIGIGNKEYNENDGKDKDWLGYDYAYKITSCYKLPKPITLKEMKEKYGIKGAPRGMVYVTYRMMDDIKLDDQKCVWKTN
ncbi:uncharacterized protein L201_003154 [Kwoniella dendrophila CBS 6074]|uniref:ASCH domain-containing protein n=1 Tax=Kwoniella dendrophila CBS 6074 TaxID=1295534 RepID=A0AAX4JTM8_9TREE